MIEIFFCVFTFFWTVFIIFDSFLLLLMFNHIESRVSDLTRRVFLTALSVFKQKDKYKIVEQIQTWSKKNNKWRAEQQRKESFFETDRESHGWTEMCCNIFFVYFSFHFYQSHFCEFLLLFCWFFFRQYKRCFWRQYLNLKSELLVVVINFFG